jgi:hypothetical protein
MTEVHFYETHYLPALFAMLGVALLFYLFRISQLIPLPLHTGLATLLLVMLFFFLPQRISVDETAIHVEFGWLAPERHTIPLEQIISSKSITYLHPGDSLAYPLNPSITPWAAIPGVGQMLILYLENGSNYLLNSPQTDRLQRIIEAKRQRHGNAAQSDSK